MTVETFPTPLRIDFEKIRVCMFTNPDLSSGPMANLITPTKDGSSHNENDRITGRCGEELVYQYLQWKYPDQDIQWMNKDGERGQPYDIRMISKVGKNQVDFIEVKTTRSVTLNTFAISMKELECLIANPDKYHIYRVYYSTEETSSTITILSQIKYNLERKHLSLSMTIPSSHSSFENKN